MPARSRYNRDAKSGFLAVTQFSDFPLPFKIKLPEGWVEQTWTSDDPPPARGREFRNLKDSGAVLCVWYRGHGLPAKTAASISTVLAKSPHKLTDDEVQMVRNGLGNIVYERMFKLASARVENIAGRSVLIVEGRWNELGKDGYHVFIPVSADCEKLEEIYLVAPPDSYPHNADAVKSALACIEWHAN